MDGLRLWKVLKEELQNVFSPKKIWDVIYVIPHSFHEYENKYSLKLMLYLLKTYNFSVILIIFILINLLISSFTTYYWQQPRLSMCQNLQLTILYFGNQTLCTPFLKVYSSTNIAHLNTKDEYKLQPAPSQNVVSLFSYSSSFLQISHNFWKTENDFSSNSPLLLLICLGFQSDNWSYSADIGHTTIVSNIPKYDAYDKSVLKTSHSPFIVSLHCYLRLTSHLTTIVQFRCWKGAYNDAIVKG